MNCLFCQQEMWSDESTKQPMLFIQYSCTSIACMVNNDFPRYICGTNKDGMVCWQEYALGDYYVKVSDQGSRIFTLTACVLREEVKMEEPLWLDSENLDAYLDKVRGWHYILWNG